MARVTDHSEGELEYVGAVSRRDKYVYLEANASKGRFIVYAKSEVVGDHALNVEYAKPVQVERINLKGKGFLNKVFLSHARNSAEKQYLDPEKKDWILSKLLLKEAGLGYIASSIGGERSLSLKLSRYVFSREGFNLKAPYKGLEDEVKIRVGKGQ